MPAAARQEAALTIEELADLVFPIWMQVKGCFCMFKTIYHCFLDDSKDKLQKELIVCAGFYGTQAQWLALSAGWRRVLRKHGLKYFKSSEYYALSGQFSRFRTSQYPAPTGRRAAEQIRAELQEVMRNQAKIRGAGIWIPLRDYAAVYARPEAKGVLPPDPYQAVLNSMTFVMVKLIRRLPGRNKKVAFVHDDEDNFSKLFRHYMAFKKANPDTARLMGGFLPMDDKEHPPLQAADMIANYALQLGLEGLRTGKAEANVREMKSNIDLFGFWSEEYILSVLKANLLTQGRPIPIDLQSDKYD